MTTPAHLTGSRRSMWLWILQRVTGIALIILLFTHILVLHYVDPNETIELYTVSREGVKLRMQHLLFILVDNLLLGFVLFHGFNGVRNVAYDYVSDPRWRRVIAALCFLAGLFLFLFALYAFVPLMLEG